MLSFLVFRPDTAAAKKSILVFLHGIGESFVNTKTGSVGLKNLFQQGVPKALNDPATLLAGGHPLTVGACTIVAPQLPLRDTPWTEGGHTEQILRIMDTVAAESDRRVYVVGFSKGGQAAFRLADDLKARAIVAIDASPMHEDPVTVGKELAACALPFWAIHTNYPADHALAKIPTMHDAMPVQKHEVPRWNDVTAPAFGAKCKSLVSLDYIADAGSRHGELCTMVTASAVPVEWLMQQ